VARRCSRTFYARGQTGQQLLLGAYQQLARQIGLGNVELYNRTELVDVVVVDGRGAGIVVRDLLTGEVTSHSAHAVVLCTGGYGNVFFLSTNAMNCNVTAAWRAHRKGAAFANPCYTQIHPTCIPQADDFQSKLTLMSESLRNDGRIWVPSGPTTSAPPTRSPRRPRLLPRALYPASATWPPATSPSRAAKRRGRQGRGVGPLEERRVPRLLRCHRPPRETSSRSATATSSRCTSASPANPYKVPMRIYPAPTTRWVACGWTTS
jgi:succinate dehydrogenase / fumarate reductase flavoprotein subunit